LTVNSDGMDVAALVPTLAACNEVTCEHTASPMLCPDGACYTRDLRRLLNRHAVPGSKGGRLFPSPQCARWEPDNFSQDLCAANSAASQAWSSLDYRLTFGSQLAQCGLNQYQILTLMGNSPDICRRHYAALVHEQMAELVEFTALGRTDVAPELAR
jgi:hypothetical protein